MKVNIRLENINEYHFKTIEDQKRRLIEQGKVILDLSIGDPDLPVNNEIIRALVEAMNIKQFNKYPPYEGIKELKLSIIKYYKDIFNVNLSFDEVLILIGSKDGINNLVPAVCSFGDLIIVPNPCYQVYVTSAYLWGVRPYKLPITEKNLYLPELNNIPEEIGKRSKLFVINYPNNPTGAEANEGFYKEIIKYCDDRDIILMNDSAYVEIINNRKTPLSLLQYDKHKNCVEIGTFSKTFNMTGFRIGYAVGNSKVLKELLKVKSNVDSGQFLPIQYAAIQALKLSREEIENSRKVYDARRSKAKSILRDKGIEYFDSNATFYLWCKIPKKYTSMEFHEKLIGEYGIITTPGGSFGNITNDYFRIALTSKVELIEKYLNKIQHFYAN